ncbi:hypothetical protein ACJOXN_02120 [Acinetobacter baumannii]
MALKLKGDTQSLQAVATGAQGYQTYNDIKGATCRLQTPGKGEKSVVGHILLGDISLIDLKKKFDKQFLKSDLSMLKGEDFFIEDFFEVAEELNIFYRELDISKSENFYVQVFEKYFRKPPTLNNSELWQELKKETEGAHLPMGASQMERLFEFCNPKKQDLYIFFDFYYCKKIFNFKNFDDLSRIFVNTYNFNFYIVGEDFLFAWCKEETVFGAGAAKKWVKCLQENW